jgi:hypothetical protein
VTNLDLERRVIGLQADLAPLSYLSQPVAAEAQGLRDSGR